VKVLELSSIKL